MILFSDTEDGLQRSVFKLQEILKQLNMVISVEKQRSWLSVINPLSTVNYMCRINQPNNLIEFNIWAILYHIGTLWIKMYIQNWPSYNRILGVLNVIFKLDLVQKYASMEAYKAVAIPILSYGCELQTNRETDRKSLTANKVFFRIQSIQDG